MNKRKIILLFSDLEGTILNEQDGTFSPEDMYQFLLQIEQLQQLTGAKVNMHLVSPVYPKQMEEIMNQIDKQIARFNRLHNHENDIPRIECGAAYPEEEMRLEEFLGDRIMALKKPVSAKDFDTARYGKANYVRNWYETYKENPNIDVVMSMYCGNGRNDLTAMEYIKKTENGFIVCPNNTRREAKAKTPFVSEKTDLLGIADGIGMINKKIKERVYKENEKDSKVIDR